MMNVIRRSRAFPCVLRRRGVARQIIGLTTMDGSTATEYDCEASRRHRVEEVLLDETGRVVYLAGSNGYTPLEQVSVVGSDAVLTYSSSVFKPASNLRHLDRMRVNSPMSDPLGWVEDFLFDWETGDIAAHVLGGDIAEPFDGKAVLFPEDVEVIEAEAVVIKEDARDHLQSEAEGLKSFLSEKSQQAKHLVKKMSDRLQSLVSAQDEPEVVRVKIKEVSDELFAGKNDKNDLAEATEFLQDKWQNLQRSIERAGKRTKSALDSAWKKLTN